MAYLFKPESEYRERIRTPGPASTALGPTPIIKMGRPVSTETKTLLFNAAPLFAIAVAYAAVSAAILPSLWRSRSRATPGDITVMTIFPAIAVIAAIYGVIVADEGQPVQGHLWLAFTAMLVGLIPAIVFFVKHISAGLVSGGQRVREAEARFTELDRELAAVTELSTALVHAGSAEAVGRMLIDSASQVLGAEFGSLVLIGEELDTATGVIARADGRDVIWNDVRLDLRNEPSGTASAVFDRAPLAVFDAQGSPLVSRRLVERARVQSIAFAPLLTEGRVLGVLAIASVSQRRVFTPDELALLQSLGNEAALALDRLRSASALADALERERLIAGIAAKFRTNLDLDAVLRVTVEETARAVNAQRAFVRLGEPGETMPVAAEWTDPALTPIGQKAPHLPVSSLAMRERRTVAVDDVETERALDDPSLGGVEALHAIGSRSVLATPIVVFDQVIGVFALHRTTAGPWSASEIGVAEAVAREAGIALHISRLLGENEEQLRLQKSLFRAAQNLTSELELETVLQRLVDELAALLDLDAADLYLYDRRRRTLRCAAVRGLPEEIVGFEFSAERGAAAEAIRRGEPVISSDYASLPDPVPHPAYEGFTDAIVAPIIWSRETRGVLGVGARGERSFGERDVDVIGAFASLAAVALRNAETFAERTRQARVQVGLSRIATVLGEPLSLTATLDAVSQAAGDALGGDFTAVLMPRSDGELELAGSSDLPAPLAAGLEQALPESAQVLLLCANERRVIAAPSLADDHRFGDRWKTLAAEAGYGALLGVPLETARGEACGVVLVFFADEHHFTDDDLELAGQLAHVARGALERSELYESERSARALAQQLARTGSLLATELDPETVLEEVVQQAPPMVGADACAVRVLKGNELVLTAACGEGVAELVGTRSSTTGRLAGDVFQSRTPAAVSDTSNDVRYAEADPLLAAGFSAYLGVPLVGPGGTVHGVLSLYARRPRTWRKEEIEAVEALAASTSGALANAELFTSVTLDRERSYAILANIADGIVAVDRESHLVLWNAAAERITGVPAGEAIGRTVEDVLHRSLSADQPGAIVPIQRGTEEVFLSVTEAVMRDPVGSVAGRIFAFRDISADRLVEEMKSEFVATVSHELRGPLTSIYGFAETLLREDVLFGEDERRTFLGYIASESERLTSIVDALLNVARLDTGDLQVELGPTDVGSVVSEVVAGVEEPTANGHRFVLDLPQSPLAAQADSDKLRQILSALIDNAVKFSPYGGTVTVAARRSDDVVEVTVEDEGVGIPRSEQERIFRKFYRGGDASSGTGLGLFIAQGLVLAMGGHLSVESEEGKGSQFTFDLPLADDSDSDEAPRV
jgi:PAS domain S-box-containing protein